MAVTNSWPGVNLLATSLDARKALAGLIETDASGTARSGVFPSSPSAIVSARSDMNVDIAAFQACAVQFGGPVLFTNDAVAQLPSALVSPGSGNNFYVVYSKINESASPGTDANNNRVIGTVVSTTSFTLARSGGARMDGSGNGLPAGAVEIGTIQMPNNKTATNQSGVVITQTFQYTAADGGVVLLRNQAEEDAWITHDGAEAYRLDKGWKSLRIGGAWIPVAGKTPNGKGVITNTLTGVVTSASWLLIGWDGQTVNGLNTPTTSRFAAIYPGQYDIGGSMLIGANTVGRVRVKINGSPIAPNFASPAVGGVAQVPISVRVELAVGDYVEVEVISDTTGNLLAGSSVTIDLARAR